MKWFTYKHRSDDGGGMVLVDYLKDIYQYEQYLYNSTTQEHETIVYFKVGSTNSSFTMDGTVEQTKKKIEKSLSDIEFNNKFDKTIKGKK